MKTGSSKGSTTELFQGIEERFSVPSPIAKYSNKIMEKSNKTAALFFIFLKQRFAPILYQLAIDDRCNCADRYAFL